MQIYISDRSNNANVQLMFWESADCIVFDFLLQMFYFKDIINVILCQVFPVLK